LISDDDVVVHPLFY